MTDGLLDDLTLLYRFARYKRHVVAGHVARLFRSVASDPSRVASNEAAVQLDISPMRPGERSFVHNSWKNSALDAPMNAPLKETGMVGRHFDRYNREVQRVLDSGATVLVAREATDPSFIYGWMAVGLVGTELALYYTFTKYRFRRLGVCSALRDRLLELAPQDEPLDYVYTARSVRDPVFERWGFEYRDLDDVLMSDEQRRAG